MSSSANATPVGFVFINDGHDWLGGLNYFRSLFLALDGAPDCGVRPVVFVGKGVDPSKYGFPGTVRIVAHHAFDRGSLPWLIDKVARRLTGVPVVTNRVARSNGVGVLSHGMPTGSRDPCAIGWIPDFQHVHLPHFFPANELAARDLEYRDLVARCDRLIVSSEAALADLRRFAPSFAYKGRVLRFTAIRPEVEDSARLDLRATYGLDGDYFFLPNQLWAHKDHVTAVRALAALRQRFPDVKVVCSGSLSDYRNPGHIDKVRTEIEQAGLQGHFLLLGSIPYPHIAQLMLGAVAVVNPSLSEGWSTPVEEAKALGVPLVLSGLAVHREQCQHGEATFFEPGNPIELAARFAARLEGWQGVATRDTSVARAAHQERMLAFARAYERIVDELAVPGVRA